MNTPKEIIELWLKELQAKRSSATARQYRFGANLFMEFIGEAEEIKKEHFFKFPAWLVQDDRDYSKASLELYTTAIKSLLSWMVENDYLDWAFKDNARFLSKCRDVTRLHEDKLPQVVPQEDTEKMIKAVFEFPEKKLANKARNIAIFLFLASSGCRNEELINLKVKDINLIERSVKVFGKGRKERMTFISENAASYLEEYWELRGRALPEDPAFARLDVKVDIGNPLPMTTTALRAIITKIQKYAGVPVFSPHKFRHYAATELLRSTKNVALVQKYLGHQNPQTTERYARINNTEVKDACQETFN